jgi:hypothetical protein
MASDFRISGASTTSRSEADIRVNYGNTQQIIAASNDIGNSTQAQFFSTDGGTTWGQNTVALQTGDSVNSDPAVDWTSDGTAWTVTIGIDAGQTNLRLRAYRSADAGATWTFDSTPSGTQTNVDREIFWVDHSATSPFRDQMYLTWHTGTPVQFARRTTGTGAAWQTPIQVSGGETTGSGIGGDVKTNADGDVFVFWQDADGSRRVYLAKSTDGGVTFGSVVTIASIFASSRKISIPADSGRQTRVYVSGGAWKTSTKDLVYAVWADLSGEAGCTSGTGPGTSVSSACKSRIWFSRSTDGGSTWASPVMLNNQSGKNDQCFPRLAVDETDGTLVVVYQDTVGDPGRIKTDVYLQTSTDDGQSWSSATKVSSAQTDETASSADSGNQYGDYLGLSGFAGVFYPAWTDRRNGAREEIWSALLRLVPRSAAFIVERSTFGQDEIDARRALPGGPVVTDAFRLVVDGFTAGELGVTGPGATVPVTSPVAGLTITCTGNESATGDYGPEVQRFSFHYDLDFGPDDTAFAFTTPTETITVSATAGGLGAAADLELIKQPNPFILHGDPPWLSVDLRVFRVLAGQTMFGVTMGNSASDAPAFIQSVMAALTSGSGTAGGQTFDSLPTGEEASALSILPGLTIFGPDVFDFALAKVHYIGLIGAQDVRMFFRLFQAQTTSAAFDDTTTYRRAPSNPVGQPIPLAGIRGGEYVTVPCFASGRVGTTDTMANQVDSPNVQTFTARTDGAEVDRWYGCWLDVNQPSEAVLPLALPSTDQDGPFTDPANPPVSLQQAIVRNPHQCLIGEIAFDPVAIPAGKDPGNWDKLAQRNLAWSDIPNPGVDGSRRALDTFEVRATNPLLPERLPPDELMIDWGGLPHGSRASVYLPEVDAAQVVRTADRLYGTHRLQYADAHTIECPTGPTTYIPIPAATDLHYAGLLSVDLAPEVRKGQEFSVVVRQITNAAGIRRGKPPGEPPVQIDVAARGDVAVGDAALSLFASASSEGNRVILWRTVLGAFQLTIPVKTKQVLLADEERMLSVLLWIAEGIAVHNRWYRVFERYLEYVRGRVTGFGGDPTKVTPSPTGAGVPSHPGSGGGGGGGHEADERLIGKVVGLEFDRYGEFCGFRLDTEDGERQLAAREHAVEDVVSRAWRDRILVAVVADVRAPHRVEQIVLLHAPRPGQA